MPALLRAGHVLPSALAEEPVVTAGDQLGPVLQQEAKSPPTRLPVCEDLGRHIAAVRTLANGAVDLVANPKICECPGPAIGHEYWSVAPCAVAAGMRTATVWIDREAKWHPRALGHPVERGLRSHLVEACVQSLGRVEAPHDRLVAITGKPTALSFFDRQVVPTHEHMFVRVP